MSIIPVEADSVLLERMNTIDNKALMLQKCESAIVLDNKQCLWKPPGGN